MSREAQRLFERTYEMSKSTMACDEALSEGLSIYYGVAMDENGYVHPDGTECEAQNVKNCPYFKKEEKVDESKDDLTDGGESGKSGTTGGSGLVDEVEKVKSIATSEQMKQIAVGSNPDQDKFTDVTVKDLDTMTAGSTKSKYRDRRNRLVEYVNSKGIGDGTYVLGDVNDEKYTRDLKKEDYDEGYMVSFQTTNGEGFNKARKDLTVSDEQYDKLVEELEKETGSKSHVGVFGGIPEISFKVATLQKAMELAKRYNQVSIWDNAMGSRAKAEEEKKEISEDEIGALWAAANILNPDYNWTENQVKKAK